MERVVAAIDPTPPFQEMYLAREFRICSLILIIKVKGQRFCKK